MLISSNREGRCVSLPFVVVSLEKKYNDLKILLPDPCPNLICVSPQMVDVALQKYASRSDILLAGLRVY